MKRYYTDKRLPKGIKIYHNDWDEYVACDGSVIAKIKTSKGYECVRSSDSLEGAIINYINNVA